MFAVVVRRNMIKTWGNKRYWDSVRKGKYQELYTLHLSTLLEIVDSMFPKKKQKIDTYSFTLARVGRGLWKFDLIDSWHKWMDKNYETHFGLYNQPEYAVAAFIEYVDRNNISIKRLMERC
jgi:hypothetical protein